MAKVDANSSSAPDLGGRATRSASRAQSIPWSVRSRLVKESLTDAPTIVDAAEHVEHREIGDKGDSVGKEVGGCAGPTTTERPSPSGVKRWSRTDRSHHAAFREPLASERVRNGHRASLMRGARTVKRARRRRSRGTRSLPARSTHAPEPFHCRAVSRDSQAVPRDLSTGSPEGSSLGLVTDGPQTCAAPPLKTVVLVGSMVSGAWNPLAAPRTTGWTTRRCSSNQAVRRHDPRPRATARERHKLLGRIPGSMRGPNSSVRSCDERETDLAVSCSRCSAARLGVDGPDAVPAPRASTSALDQSQLGPRQPAVAATSEGAKGLW